MAARISVTFITPHQRATTGGVYAIHQFARLAPDWMERRLVVAKGETTPIEGVEVLGPERLAALDLPPADLLVIPADFDRAEALAALPIDRGMPVALLQGFGAPGNPVVTANLKRVRHALAVSQWLVDAARRTGCPATLVRYGLDRELFHPPADDGRHAPGADAVVAMMTHQIEWKATDDGLAALGLARAALPELEIRLFGRGGADLDGARHLGALARADVAELMRACAIFVCSSWEEGFGLPGLEAIECGAALATTDTLGSRDYALDQETALVSPPRDPQALADSIVRLAREPQLRRRLVAAGRRHSAARYPDWPAAAAAFAEALAAVAPGGSARRPEASPAAATPAAGAAAAPAAGAPRSVVVLGPSRSGTSAVMGLLTRLGVEVGAPPRLLAAGAANPKGFYEHRELVAVDDALLARLGGAWDRPPRPEPGWAADPAFADLRERARALIAGELAPGGRWGLKDPRLCVTLPFWRELLDEPAFVICHRNPVEVAQSLARRDGLGEDAGLDLWARTMAAALVNTAGARRFFAGYDELFAAPERLLADLADLLERPQPAGDAAGEWVDGALRHHAVDPAQAVLHPGLSGRRGVLHLLLERAVRSRSEDPALRGAAVDSPLGEALNGVAAAVLADADTARRSPMRPGGALPPAERGAGAPRRWRTRAPGGASPRAEPDPRAGIEPGTERVVLGFGPDALEAVAQLLAADAGAARIDLLDHVQTPQVRAWALAHRLAPARVVVVLPDPVRRAVRAHERAGERRGLARALREQLPPAALQAARADPTPTNAYVVDGEYERLVDALADALGEQRLLVVFEDDVAAAPAATAQRLGAFLGADPHDAPASPGGAPRPEPGALPAPEPEQKVEIERRLLDGGPGDPPDAAPRLEPALEAALRAHYAPGAAALARRLGRDLPWPTAAPARCPNVARPAVSVVVLVHDTPAEVETLVRSIVAHTDDAYELLLVDNGSGPRAGAALRELADEVGARRLRFDENRHFAVAMNAAIAQAAGDELALLNSDTIVTAGWLRNLRAALHSGEDVAMVGPRSNSAHLAQGGVWLDDLSAPGIERFARGFNHPDPRRWFEVDWLVGFAVLARRSALQRVGGFDETIRTGDHEDHDLGDRLRAAGYRLLCAGDTFVAHLGQRTYQRAGVNRTTLRFGGREADRAVAPGTPTRLLRDARGRVFEVADGVASFIETRTTLALLRRGREIEDAGSQLDDVAFGPPAYVVRAGDGDDVWVIAGDRRTRVTGDPQRIRRLPGLAVIERDDLEALPPDGTVAVEDALPPVPEIEPLLPANPAAIEPAALAPAPAVAQAAAAALDAGAGYALVGLGARDVATLNDGAWPLPEPPPAGAGQPTAAALRAAILDADALAVPVRRDAFAVAPLLERLLFHYDLYPPLRCSTAAPYELLGFDAESGAQLDHAPLLDVLADRPLAVAGPLGDAALRFGDLVGLDVRRAVELDGVDGVDDALRALAARRGEFDAVLVAAGAAGGVLCGRLARELGAVALDLAAALDRLLYVRHPAHAPADVDRRWRWERYLREAAEPPADDPHPLEGRLVREAGTAPVFLVERGRRRWVASRDVLAAIGGEVAEVAGGELDALPDGLSISILHERSGAHVVPLGGRRIPVDLGLPVVAVDDLPTDLLGHAERELRWFPSAGGR